MLRARSLTSWIVAAVLAGGCQHGSASPAKSLRCTGVDWRGFDRPLVATEATALAIGAAIIAENAPEEHGGPYELKIEDEGDHWTVFQYKPPERLEDGTVVLQFGGGVELLINKCDGKIRSLRGQK
jgi:hypothetical protein